MYQSYYFSFSKSNGTKSKEEVVKKVVFNGVLSAVEINKSFLYPVPKCRLVHTRTFLYLPRRILYISNTCVGLPPTKIDPSKSPALTAACTFEAIEFHSLSFTYVITKPTSALSATALEPRMDISFLNSPSSPIAIALTCVAEKINKL